MWDHFYWRYLNGQNPDDGLPLFDGTGTDADGIARGKLSREDIDNRIGAAGMWWDPHLGIYHVRHRAYDPRLGRFLQPDPIGVAGGWNVFEYVGGDPASLIDPMGLCAAAAGGGDNHTWKHVYKQIKHLGVSEDDARNFAEWLEEMKEGGQKAAKEHADKDTLIVLYEKYIEARQGTNQIPVGIQEAAKRSRKNLGPHLGKKMMPYGFALGIIFTVAEAAEAFSDPNNPCRRYTEELFRQHKAGEFHEEVLDRFAAMCQDFHLSQSRGWDAWMLTDEMNKEFKRGLRESKRQREIQKPRP